MDEILHQYYALIFVAVWVLISFTISRMGGWHVLAQHYHRRLEPSGERWRFQSAQFRRMTSYSNILFISANRRGLWLSVLFLFRLGHPPLFIPWNKIEVSKETKFFQTMTRFEVSGIPIYIRESLADKIQKAAADGWPGHS